jgi:hypothetical protein
MDGMESEPPATGFAWPGEESLVGVGAEENDGLWTRSRDFDWGD